MQHFNFHRLLNKYGSKNETIIFEPGHYDNSGDFVTGTQKTIEIQGAVINFKESRVYRSEGSLTMKDKRLFTEKPIENALHGSKVKFGDNVYTIEENSENAVFTGVYSYTLKFVSSIGGGKDD